MNDARAMIAVRSVTDADGERLVFENSARPVPGVGEVLIRVTAAGLNRADILQRQGRYALPAGASDVLGMELSGTVIGLGEGVESHWLGQLIVALVTSGGYATHAVVDVRTILPVPAAIDLLDAAGLVEAAATVVSNIAMVGRFHAGETVLIHGGSGGIAAFAIQFIVAMGGRVAVTGSSDEKLRYASDLGAEILINYKTEDFASRMRESGGADIILDTVAGGYLARNLEALATHGRIVTIGMQGGREDTLDFSVLTKKKAAVFGTLLRDRSIEEKQDILARTEQLAWPLLSSGKVRMTTDSVFPLREAEHAHRRMREGQHLGKILLDCSIEAAAGEQLEQRHPSRHTIS
jgi:NADPH2:quinone reductase